MPSPIGLLTTAVVADPARPRITWYDDASGERVELSGATLQTWVAKTAHFLAGDLGVGAGSRVSVDLPLHWTAAVWWLAVDAVEAQLLGPADDVAGPPDVAVVGPAALAAPPEAGELVAVSLNPMGAPFVDALPPLVHDFSVEVRTQPDHFPFPRGRDTPDGRAAVELARTWRLGAGDRLLVVGGALDHVQPLPGLLAPVLLAPLAADASVVWVRNPARPSDVQRAVAEQVTAVVDVPGDADPQGTSVPTTQPASAWPRTIRTLHHPPVS